MLAFQNAWFQHTPSPPLPTTASAHPLNPTVAAGLELEQGVQTSGWVNFGLVSVKRVKTSNSSLFVFLFSTAEEQNEFKLRVQRTIHPTYLCRALYVSFVFIFEMLTEVGAIGF